jgi:hypothetical protein
MEVWQIVLYAVAALVALRSLTSLMTAYRERLLREIAEQEEAFKREEQARAKAEKAAQKNKPRRAGAA